MGDFRMPSLGADMDAGTVLQWLVEPGDPVHRGQIIAVVDTAKAAIEIEAFEDGVLEAILVGPGKKVPVGTPLARISAGAVEASATTAAEPVAEGSPSTRSESTTRRATPPVRHLARQLGVELAGVVGTGPQGRITHDDLRTAASDGGQRTAGQRTVVESSAAEPPAAEPPAAEPSVARPSSARSTGVPPSRVAVVQARTGDGRPRVTPRARRLAALRGIDLNDVVGTGADGAVLGDDLSRRAPVGQAVPSPTSVRSEVQDPDVAGPGVERTAAGSGAGGSGASAKAAMRTAIANLMSRSNAEIPHYYVSQTVDLAPAFAWLAEHNVQAPPSERVLPAAMFLRATVLSALAVPDLNAHWVDGQLRRCERVDVGVAVATRGGGLVTPTLADAGDLEIDALMAAFRDLVHRARRGALRQREMSAASITMSSLGETGPDALVGVIFPPQVALVGLGGIVQRPWAIHGMLAVRPTVTVTVAADHRATDGRTAAAFVTRFDRALQNPEEL